MKQGGLKEKIREVVNFPTYGIKYKDIAPLIEDKDTFRVAVKQMTSFFKNMKVDKVVAVDARGFLFASAVAYLLNAGLVMVRKKGKLPYKKIVQLHTLEYGKGSLEIHTDSVLPGERVAIIDDVLATGGTSGAVVRLVKKLKGKIVGIAFLIEIPKLHGRKKLQGYKIKSLIKY